MVFGVFAAELLPVDAGGADKSSGAGISGAVEIAADVGAAVEVVGALRTLEDERAGGDEVVAAQLAIKKLTSIATMGNATLRSIMNPHR